MKRSRNGMNESRLDTARILSVSYAYPSAVRFYNALRFCFYAFFFAAIPIRGNCPA